MNMKHRPHEEPIFADERQQQIADLVTAHGKVRTAQLTTLLGVTEPTLRKDLSVLEERGLLKRTHGGAVSVRPPLEQEVANRVAYNAEAKQAIALACVQEISEREAIFLDSGTTVFQLAQCLGRGGRYVTVLDQCASSSRNHRRSPNYYPCVAWWILASSQWLSSRTTRIGKSSPFHDQHRIYRCQRSLRERSHGFRPQ